MLPDGGRDTRIRHYVLRAQPVVGTQGTRLLTISTHSVLRYGEFDGSGKPVLWNEYDPLQPVVGWDLETVLERLGEVLGQIDEHVERLEARVAERAQTLNSLLKSSPVTNRPLGGRASPAAAMPGAAAPMADPKPPAPITVVRTVIQPAPLPSDSITYGTASTIETAPTPVPNDVRSSAASNQAVVEQRLEATPQRSNDVLAEFGESMPELALIDLAFGELSVEHEVPAATDDGEASAEPTEVFPMVSLDTSAISPAAPVAGVDASALATVEREKRERRLFQHLRAR